MGYLQHLPNINKQLHFRTCFIEFYTSYVLNGKMICRPRLFAAPPFGMQLLTLLIEKFSIIVVVEVISDSLFIQVFLGLKLLKMN